ncbi:alkaline phosphatase family protein [Thalassobaculum sp.]|uniref:alkaline phosphatase family protein n=1 Tax=Thalassobaculum sp. TaxID=2022740 RepID=UPI0032F06076
MSARPDILLITLDQFRGDSLSSIGHPCVRTPHLDALAGDGVLFRNHYATCAPCSPARASLLTGLYQMNHRVCRNGTPLDARHATVATVARAAGYDPLLFGYTDQSVDPRGLAPNDPRLRTYEGIAPGFAVHTDMAEPSPLWRQWLKQRGVDLGTRERDVFRPRGSGEPPAGPHREPPAFGANDTETAFLTGRMIEHLSSLSPVAEPSFLHVSQLRPHPPFVVPEPYNTMVDPRDTPLPVRATDRATEAAQHPYLAYELNRIPLASFVYEAPGLAAEMTDDAIATMRATYYGMIAEVDAQVGRTIAFLKETGRYDRTLIIVTSDHGEMLGDHRLLGKLGYFDAAYHIPLIIKPAGGTPAAGRVVEAFTEAVDVTPTILELVGAEAPPAMDGRSLAPFLEGGSPKQWRDAVHWEYDFREIGKPEVQDKLGLPVDTAQLAVLRDKAFKYVHFTGLPPLLFDLSRDPAELEDRSEDPDYASVRADYAGRMLSWRMAHADRTLSGWNLIAPGGPTHVAPDRGRW